jgi:hypothetical protein
VAAVVAFAAHYVRAHRDPIPDAQWLAVKIDHAGHDVCHNSDILVPWNEREWRRLLADRAAVLGRLAAIGVFVRAANAAHLHLHEQPAGLQRWNGILAHFDLVGCNNGHGPGGFGHQTAPVRGEIRGFCDDTQPVYNILGPAVL